MERIETNHLYEGSTREDIGCTELYRNTITALTARRRGFLETSPFVHLPNSAPVLCGTRQLISLFTKAGS
jgi:hypothetical protein